jgi:hypothetical protein
LPPISTSSVGFHDDFTRHVTWLVSAAGQATFAPSKLRFTGKNALTYMYPRRSLTTTTVTLATRMRVSVGAGGLTCFGDGPEVGIMGFVSDRDIWGLMLQDQRHPHKVDFINGKTSRLHGRAELRLECAQIDSTHIRAKIWVNRVIKASRVFRVPTPRDPSCGFILLKNSRTGLPDATFDYFDSST